MNLKELTDYGKAEKETYVKWIKKAKKANSRSLDDQFHKLHQEAFRKIDCLVCANCCKTTSPIFRDVDIKRLSKRLRMPESKFIDTYLKIDEDQDYVLRSSPCAFLGDDNYCSVYEDRPLACREYPHTDRKNMYQILPLTRKNMEVCPAVSYIMKEISKKI
ncbi:YkgJ family cysteine cluster protein [Fluviicola sp.]|uniref:YkgJ family cysteine cluster protein n=1 Tax=Fluviicola sp. TaxID=1917219 RepID=UPI0031D60C87